MPEFVLRDAGGTLRVQGWRQEAARRAAALLLELAREGKTRAEVIDFDGGRAYLKASRLRGSAAWRHALHRLHARPVPRVQEYQNLAWLAERHFATPAPLAAGVLVSKGLPRFHALLTEHLPGTRTLEETLEDGRERGKADLLDELAREVARMHALGFVHHDLFARNVLVRPGGEGQLGRRLVFLDCWAGGPPTPLRARGPAYDLACLLLDVGELAGAGEARFLERYFHERAAQGRPAPVSATRASLARARRALRRRLVREPRRLRGRPLPSAGPGLVFARIRES